MMNFTREMMEKYIHAKAESYKNPVVKIIPKRNAVIIDFDENNRPQVTIECKDYNKEYFLTEQARIACGIWDRYHQPKESK